MQLPESNMLNSDSCLHSASGLDGEKQETGDRRHNAPSGVHDFKFCH